MQLYYRRDEGFEARAEAVLTKACKKLVVDIHYEARVQAIVTYHKSILGENVKKSQARSMTLTRDQYIQVDKEY
jgi:predicted nucleotidyltransferase